MKTAAQNELKKEGAYMGMREQAIVLIERMSEEDLQIFLSLFGRLYPAETSEPEVDTSEFAHRFSESNRRFIEDDDFEDFGCLDFYGQSDDAILTDKQLKEISKYFSND